MFFALLPSKEPGPRLTRKKFIHSGISQSIKTPSPANQLRYPCRFCGRKHEGKRTSRPAWGKCIKCGKENHFGNKCPSTSNRVSLREEEDELPVFQVFKVSAKKSSDSDLVTLKVTSGNFKTRQYFILCHTEKKKTLKKRDWHWSAF